MKRKYFFLITLVLFVLISIVGSFAAGRLYRIHGTFVPDVTWTGGHPWKVTFDIGSSNSGYSATIDESGFLSWYLWLWNVWWATFNHGNTSCRPQIICPDNILQNPNQICPVHGCVWSQNAWWVVLSGSLIGTTYTGTYYNPNSTLIEGFGWNRWLGWVPFFSEVGSITSISQSWITAWWLSVNFVGKIAIIGNIAGTRIFNVPNQNVGYVFTTTKHADIINAIRKNLAILSRNIDDTTLADVNSNFTFLVKKNGDYAFDISNPVWPTAQWKRTIFVVGHDIVLDTTNDIGHDSDGITRAIVALKDDNGNGWNIIITDKVKEIYAFLYADWSIFSWEKDGLGNIVPYVASGALNIPTNQLYLKGLLVSKNTIGGAQQVPTVCPVVINNCNLTNSQMYDLNYFRTYDWSDPTQRSLPLWITDVRLQNAPMVIEYNASILSDPPPGLVHSFD